MSIGLKRFSLVPTTLKVFSCLVVLSQPVYVAWKLPTSKWVYLTEQESSESSKFRNLCFNSHFKRLVVSLFDLFLVCDSSSLAFVSCVPVHPSLMQGLIPLEVAGSHFEVWQGPIFPLCDVDGCVSELVTGCSQSVSRGPSSWVGKGNASGGGAFERPLAPFVLLL